MSQAKRSTTVLLGLALALSFAGACQRSDTTNTAGAAPSGEVWATVDGHSITKETVEKAYRAALDPTATPSDEEALGAKLNIIDELVTQELLFQRAVSEKLEAPATEVDAAYNERKSNMTDAQFQLELSQRGLSAEDLRATIGKELAIRKLLERDVTQKVVIPDADVNTFFEQNRAQFNLPEAQYRLAQIIVAPGKDPNVNNRRNSDAGTPAEMQAKVNDILERLKAGEDFGDLAVDFSEDPQSLPQGGDLGFVPASRLRAVSPQLLATVQKMQPGNVNTVKLGDAFSIFLLLGAEPAGQRDLSQPGVRENIKGLLQSRKEDVLRAAYITNLHNNAKIVNHLAQQIVDQYKNVTPAPAAPLAK